MFAMLARADAALDHNGACSLWQQSACLRTELNVQTMETWLTSTGKNSCVMKRRNVGVETLAMNTMRIRNEKMQCSRFMQMRSGDSLQQWFRSRTLRGAGLLRYQNRKGEFWLRTLHSDAATTRSK